MGKYDVDIDMVCECKGNFFHNKLLATSLVLSSCKMKNSRYFSLFNLLEAENMVCGENFLYIGHRNC